MTLSVKIYSVDTGIRSAVRKGFEGDAVEVLEITDSTKFGRENINEERQAGTMGRLTLPDNADFVVSRSALNSRIEGLAATLALKQGRRDVLAFVLPEGLDWLRDQLAKRGSLVLVGSDQAK